MLWVFGMVAGVLQSLFYVPYIRDVMRGSTRPHRGSWTIWCVLSVIVLASQPAPSRRSIYMDRVSRTHSVTSWRGWVSRRQSRNHALRKNADRKFGLGVVVNAPHSRLNI